MAKLKPYRLQQIYHGLADALAVLASSDSLVERLCSIPIHKVRSHLSPKVLYV